MDISISAGRPEDLPALAAIYDHDIVTSHATFVVEPLSDETLRAWFDGFGECGRHRLFVARDDGRVLGYASSSTYRPRAAYAPSVETSVYLDEGATGRGIGTALLSTLIAELEAEDVHSAYAGIAQPNAASVRLHERVGYRHVGTFTEQGRKFGRYWDVAWYERRFQNHRDEEA